MSGPDFDQWLRANGFNFAALSEPQRNHLHAAYVSDAQAAAGSDGDLIAIGLGAVDFTAGDKSGGKAPTVKMRAYSGGPMDVGMGRPVIVDLAGMTPHSPSVPLLLNHDETQLVGTGTPTVGTDGVSVQGVITGKGGAAKEVTDHAAGGYPWKASIGAKINKRENLDDGKTAVVNGRTVKGPMLIARGSVLHEVSFVPSGADGSTSATISAKVKSMFNGLFNRGTEGLPTGTIQAGTEPQTVDPIRTEQDRQVAIMRACGGQFAEIQAHAIREGWDTPTVELEILRASRGRQAARTGAPSGTQFIVGHQAEPRDILAAACLIRIGHDKLAEAIGPQAAQCARDLRARHTMDILAASLSIEGKPAPSNPDDLIRAAFSTSSLPNALADILRRVLFSRYAESYASWEPFAYKAACVDFRPHTGIRPGAVENLREVGATGELTHTVIREEANYNYSVDTFGRMCTISRQQLINDDLGYFDQLGASFAQAAKRTASDLVYKTILANAGSFFGAGNGNYASGGGTALAVASLAAGIATMRKQVDSFGHNIDVVPKFLVVPPELESTARAIVQSEYLQQLVDTLVPTGNPLRDLLQVQVEPRLSNSNNISGGTTPIFPNNSTTGWYLMGGPENVPVVFASLQAGEGPSVQTFGMDSNPAILAMTARVFWDLGFALADPKACYFAAGA